MALICWCKGYTYNNIMLMQSHPCYAWSEVREVTIKKTNDERVVHQRSRMPFYSVFLFFFFFFSPYDYKHFATYSDFLRKRKEKGNLQRIKCRRGVTYVVISSKPPQNLMHNRTTKWFSHWTVDRKRIMFELFIRVFVFIWRYLTYVQIRRVIKEVQEYSCNSRYIF